MKMINATEQSKAASAAVWGLTKPQKNVLDNYEEEQNNFLEDNDYFCSHKYINVTP